MARRITHLLPAAGQTLAGLGIRIALARSRRRISRKQMAQRAGLTEFTLRRVEQGEGSVTLAAYLAVLQALGLAADLDQVAADDPLGRDLQDAPLLGKIGRRCASRPGSAASTSKQPQDGGAKPPSPSSTPAVSTDDIVRIISGPAYEEPQP